MSFILQIFINLNLVRVVFTEQNNDTMIIKIPKENIVN